MGVAPRRVSGRDHLGEFVGVVPSEDYYRCGYTEVGVTLVVWWREGRFTENVVKKY